MASVFAIGSSFKPKSAKDVTLANLFQRPTGLSFPGNFYEVLLLCLPFQARQIIKISFAFHSCVKRARLRTSGFSLTCRTRRNSAAMPLTETCGPTSVSKTWWPATSSSGSISSPRMKGECTWSDTMYKYIPIKILWFHLKHFNYFIFRREHSLTSQSLILELAVWFGRKKASVSRIIFYFYFLIYIKVNFCYLTTADKSLIAEHIQDFISDNPFPSSSRINKSARGAAVEAATEAPTSSSSSAEPAPVSSHTAKSQLTY